MSTPEPNPQQTPATMAPPALPPVPPAGTVNPAAPSPMRRSPGLALVLSFFPGLGHLYLGLYQRAIGIFLCFAAGIFLSEHAGSLGILTAFVWFFAVIDAYRQAQALNLGLAPEPMALGAAKAKSVKRGSLGFGVFLLIIGAALLYNQFYPIDFTFLEDWWPMLLVLAGVYMVGAHFIEKGRIQRRELQADLPPVDPSQPS